MQVLCPCQMLPLTFSLLLNPHCFRILPSLFSHYFPRNPPFPQHRGSLASFSPCNIGFYLHLSTFHLNCTCLHSSPNPPRSTATETHPVKLCYTRLTFPVSAITSCLAGATVSGAWLDCGPCGEVRAWLSYLKNF